ncbi:hypothetical protein SMALB_1144 [Streptomyces malaysiensis]|uniref:Uncharacterized protein n=1 Tax=Streptomyces malaysiensis TaxID=92644 RepID=A0A7X6AV00_STRMQ|nr:hypothetical protein [Streptomyces malaysiensis]
MADGLIDSRKDTTCLTVSWNRLQQNNKSFGIGWTENTTADITTVAPPSTRRRTTPTPSTPPTGCRPS